VGQNRNTGRLELLALDLNGRPRHNFESAPGVWAGWSPLGSRNVPALNQIAVANTPGGAVLATGISRDGRVWEIGPNNSPTGWGSAVGPDAWFDMGVTGMKEVKVGLTSDGRMQIYALAGNGVLFRSESADGGTFWSVFQCVGGPAIASLTVANTQGGRLVVVAIGADRHAYTFAETTGWWADMGRCPTYGSQNYWHDSATEWIHWDPVVALDANHDLVLTDGQSTASLNV
jgi:hypothetical protein